jgi:hypothetical protein
MFLWDSNILRYHNQGHPTLIAGNHIVVTRNQKDFVDLLPKHQLQNWIDDPPTS